MIIQFGAKSYNTLNANEYLALSTIVTQLIDADDQISLDEIRAQIEEASLISKNDLRLYKKIAQNKMLRYILSYQYFKPPGKNTGKYTYDGKHFITLPDGNNKKEIVAKLITTLLYEAQRHHFNQYPCNYLRKIIAKIEPEHVGCNKRDYEEAIEAIEIRTKNYYGEYPSDDSDSEDEKKYNTSSKEKQAIQQQKANTFRNRGEIKRYQFKVRKTLTKPIKEKEPPPTPHLQERENLHNTKDRNNRQVRDDLKRLNEAALNGTLTQVLPDLQTKFMVTQYRGITYSTKLWNAPARRKHRKLDERNRVQFCMSVIKAAGFNTYNDYLDALEKDEKLEERLITIAKKLQENLIQLRKFEPYIYNGYTYLSIAHLLQYLYSSNYDEFHRFITKNIHSVLKDYLLNEFNPFVSVGDTPYHALKYAYGTKFYKGHKDERLRPRWRQDGTAERPYSGKVYVSLHPIDNYLEDGPLHVPTLVQNGDIPLNNEIAPELESCFPAYIPPNRVTVQHVAKYPSFKQIKTQCKQRYYYKYGLSHEDFKKYQEAIKRFPPHSKERRFIKYNLGEYLCSYQEVRLISKARRTAKKQGAILIYRNTNGGFSFDPPRSVPKSDETTAWTELNTKRNIRRQFAPIKEKEIAKLTAASLSKFLSSQNTKSGSQYPQTYLPNQIASLNVQPVL